MNEYADYWVRKAVDDLQIDEEILFEAPSVEQQRIMKKMFTVSKDNLMKEDPTNALAITIHTRRHDGRFWIILKKRMSTLTTAFIRRTGDNITKVEVPYDLNRERRLRLMFKDGMTKDEILALDTSVTEEELDALFNV